MDGFRQYALEDLGPDGYPPQWHETLKHVARERAGNRCVRCGHPYTSGEYPMERDADGAYVSWSPCDAECEHPGPFRITDPEGATLNYEGWLDADSLVLYFGTGWKVEARARILTVHHLDGDKANCRWWNLAPLCQRCHLTIQGKVIMARVWPWEHSEWFRPFVAGYYAHAYLGEELSRDEAEERLQELLSLERMA